MRALWFSVLVLTVALAAELPLTYPHTRKTDQLDDYHGVKVADPYRWLEDDKSTETMAWVAEQNQVTFSYLNQIPYRAKLRERLKQLLNYPKYSAPARRGERFFFTKNDGLQNQSVWYVQTGLTGTPELLLDPNKFSTDGTTRLNAAAISRDGKYFAYGVSTGGSDWLEAHVMEVSTRKVLPDQLKWLKVTGLSWAKDGLFYSRYPAPEAGHEMSGKNEFHKVYFHRLGTAQSEDQLVYEDPAHPQRFNIVQTTEDQRFAILDVSDRGTGKKGNAVFFRDVSKPGSSFLPIVAEIGEDSYGVIENVGDQFLIQTDHGAPNGRVMLYDPEKRTWKDILPEKPEPLHSASTAGGKLFALYSKDVATHAYVYSLDGKLENEIALPGLGTAGGFSGLHDDSQVFYSFTSLNYPPAIFRYDIASRQSTAFRVPEIPGFHPDNYESKEVFVTSKDGTRVPMFLVHKKGLKLDGSNPAVLTGYGGFNITETPSFSAVRLALLEQGVVFASANMRGGGEYGEKWHAAGMKLHKQNVFDDFIAAAEWLIRNKYTSPEHFAINGTSNGGLLIGAVINQRPELFRVAVPQAGVMDMLRFQKFTIGWNWISDYGSSDNATEFAALRAYSPIHNVRAGGKYPAVFITTADHDDRVVPAHSFKYAAEMQENASPQRPVLIRVETNSGHGPSSTGKQIEITADVYAFILYNLGVPVKL
jgi:prolyl oligopeptidase